MLKFLSTGLAMTSLLFAACDPADPGQLPPEGVALADTKNVAQTQALQPGDVCGGIQGNRYDCGKGYFCAYPISAQCGAGDQTGICTAIPSLCPSGIRYNPVCGCDGNTYDGGCNAALSLSSVQRVGACDENITGAWTYTGDRQYNYSFDPDGTFTRTIRQVCTQAPCPLYIVESQGSYVLQGTLLGLAYTSGTDVGATAQFTIEGTAPEQHLRGKDAGVEMDLTHVQ